MKKFLTRGAAVVAITTSLTVALPSLAGADAGTGSPNGAASTYHAARTSIQSTFTGAVSSAKAALKIGRAHV